MGRVRKTAKDRNNMNAHLLKSFFIVSCLSANSLMADRESVEDFTIHSEGGLVFPSFEGQRILDIRNSQRNGFEDVFFVFLLNHWCPVKDDSKVRILFTTRF